MVHNVCICTVLKFLGVSKISLMHYTIELCESLDTLKRYTCHPQVIFTVEQVTL